jgi:hypothetical protein
MHKKITFFNCFHNGDIHASRSFIRLIINKVHQQDPSVTFFYAHKNAANLLDDIENLKYDPHAIRNVINEHANLFMAGGSLFINTWYAQRHYKYMNRHGITLDSLYIALDETCKNVWGFSLADISQDPTVFFPSIDYSKFEIKHAKEWLTSHPGKKIFISNGYALSGQSHNFPITPLVITLAKKHTDKIFILSNQEENANLPNVFQSSHIIQKNGCDLNENAFLSERCDTIIGRASGAFAFAETQNNFQRNCKILCFSNLIPPPGGKFWLSDLLKEKITYTATITVTNENNIATIQDMMERHL